MAGEYRTAVLCRVDDVIGVKPWQKAAAVAARQTESDSLMVHDILWFLWKISMDCARFSSRFVVDAKESRPANNLSMTINEGFIRLLASPLKFYRANRAVDKHN